MRSARLITVPLAPAHSRQKQSSNGSRRNPHPQGPARSRPARAVPQQANGHGDGTRLIEAAIQLGFVSEEAGPARRSANEVGLDFIDLAEADVDLSLLKTFPQKLIHRQTLFPIRRDHGQLVVATSDPFDLYPLDEVSAATACRSCRCWPAATEIAKLIKKHLGVGSETVDGLIAAATRTKTASSCSSDIETDGSELSEMAQEASVVRLVNEILLEAIESRASDVHIESQPSGIAHSLPHRRHAAAAAGARRRSTAFRPRSSAA